MSNLKKVVALTLSIMLVGSLLLSGCSTQKQQGQSNISSTSTLPPNISQHTKITIYRGGSSVPTEPEVLAEVTKRTKDIVNADIETVPTSWGDYANKLNVTAASGAQMDAFSIWLGGETDFISKPGFIQPLDDLINKYAPDLKKKIPKEAWDAVTHNGKIMALPQYWPQKIGATGVIRMDLFEQSGITKVPQTPNDLEQGLIAVHKKFPDMIVSSTRDYKNLLGVFTGWYGYDEASQVRTGSMSFYYDDSSKNFKPYFEHPSFQKGAEAMQRWYKEGLIDKDQILRTSDQVNNMFSSGKLINIMGEVSSIDAYKLEAAVPSAKMELLPFFTKKTQPLSIQNMILITTSSTNKEKIIKLFDWVWSNEDNYNLVMSGIEGKHFVKQADGNIALPKGYTPANPPYPGQLGTVFEDKNYYKFPVGTHPIFEKYLHYSWEYKDYFKPSTFGFLPDITKYNDIIPTQNRLIDEYQQGFLLGTKSVGAINTLSKTWYDNCKGQAQLDDLNKQFGTFKNNK